MGRHGDRKQKRQCMQHALRWHCRSCPYQMPNSFLGFPLAALGSPALGATVDAAVAPAAALLTPLPTALGRTRRMSTPSGPARFSDTPICVISSKLLGLIFTAPPLFRTHSQRPVSSLNPASRPLTPFNS